MSAKIPLRLIFLTIMIDMIGLGILIPILPDLIRRFSADPVFVTHYYGYFIAMFAVMQFFMAPILGALSDKFGRRPVLLVSLFGAAVDYVIMAFAPALWILFAGRVIAGATAASVTVANSYIADISNDTNRAANFGMIGAAFGLGFIVGPMLGGLLGHFDHSYPFLAAAALNLMNAMLVYFRLPESLPETARRAVEFHKLNPFRSVMRVLKPSPILGLIVIYALIQLAGQVHPSNWTLYTQYKFGWSELQVGLSLTTVGIAVAASQIWLTRWLVPKMGERNALMLGMFIYAIGYALFASVTQGWMMYPVLIFFALSSLAMPALQSIISKTVPANEQGELQGSLVSFSSLASIAAPLMYSALFVHFTAPGVPVPVAGICYYAASFICVLALLLFAYEAYHLRLKRTGTAA